MDSLGIVAVLLPLTSHLVSSLTVQLQIYRKSQRVKSAGMKFIHLSLQVFQRDAAHPADGICKIFINQLLGDSHCLKNPGA